jgi:hypothetical protein
MNTRKVLIIIVATVLIVAGGIGAMVLKNQNDEVVRLKTEVEAKAKAEAMNWPQVEGVYTASSSDSIPQFPTKLSGYRSKSGRDFWGHPFETRGSLRIFQNNEWFGIHQFPNTMNDCSNGVFMIRWRSANPNVRVESSVRYQPDDNSAKTEIGNFGYMSGSNCDQPMFKFTGSSDGATMTLTDIYYELKFWQAAP